MSKYLVYIKGDEKIDTADSDNWKTELRTDYFACKYTSNGEIEKVVKPSGNNITADDNETLQKYAAKTNTLHSIIMKFDAEKQGDVFNGDILFPNDNRTFTYNDVSNELTIVKEDEVVSNSIDQPEPEPEAPVKVPKSLQNILQELTSGASQASASTVLVSKDQNQEQPKISKGWDIAQPALSDGKLQQHGSPQPSSAISDDASLISTSNPNLNPDDDSDSVNSGRRLDSISTLGTDSPGRGGGKRKTKSKRSSKKKRNTKKKRKTQNKKKSSRKRSKK